MTLPANTFISDDQLYTLFGSKTRVRLLKLFFLDPKESFYVRELTRLTGLQINAVRRELANLIDIGIIRIDDGRNRKLEVEALKNGAVHRGQSGVERKYYTANPGFAVYNEMRKFFERLKTLSKEAFGKMVDAKGDVDLLVLTGIFLDNEEFAVDVLLVGDMDPKVLGPMIKDLGTGYSRELNYTILSREEFLYRKEVVDKFLYTILDNERNIILINKLGDKAFV
jgi:hypothetical protein